eukprot:15292936-Alexandrium_andersonii.AAC.1
MSRRSDNGASPKWTRPSFSVRPMLRRKRVCTLSRGARVESAACEMAAVRYSMKDKMCAL